MSFLASRLMMKKQIIVALIDNILQVNDFPKHSICDAIKVLGIYFGYDEKQKNNVNFSQTLKTKRNQ